MGVTNNSRSFIANRSRGTAIVTTKIPPLEYAGPTLFCMHPSTFALLCASALAGVAAARTQRRAWVRLALRVRARGHARDPGVRGFWDRADELIGPWATISPRGRVGADCVECSRDACNTFKAIAAPDLLAPFVDDARVYTRADVDAVLRRALEHVRVRGERVAIEDTIVLDVVDAYGAPFPLVHTDIEWGTFANDGFQVWMLVRNDSATRNSMFVYESDAVVAGGDNNVRLDDQGVPILRAPATSHRAASTAPVDLRGTASYLDFVPGDCLVFGQNLLHASDYRPFEGVRRALNFRVLLRDTETGGLCIGAVSPEGRLSRLYAHLTKIRAGSGVVGRYELANL